MNVVVISKSDFDKLKSHVPAFGDVFRAIARTRAAGNIAEPGLGK